MTIQDAKKALDKVIDKARIHLYKPIQIAEILYRDRVYRDIQLLELETYRTASKKWRDVVCLQFLGRTSTSSARYQDDIFNENAIPPRILAALGNENREKKGIVEAYIYQKFAERFSQVMIGLEYCVYHDKNTFQLAEFLDLFWAEAGLRRSIDKVYEIVVYALFSALVEVLELSIEVSYNPDKQAVLKDFSDFADKVLNLNTEISTFKTSAKIYRAGVTNAADRGLDMWANFGLAIQIKHLSLNQEVAEGIVNAVNSDRIVIVCKDAERTIIVSLLNQIGWKSKIQSIITESDLIAWYEKGLRGNYRSQIGDRILEILANEIKLEFPSTNGNEFQAFYESREYHLLKDSFWSIY